MKSILFAFAALLLAIAGPAHAYQNLNKTSCSGLYPSDATACLQAVIDTAYNTTNGAQVNCSPGNYNFTQLYIYPNTYINFEPGCHWFKTANGPGLHTADSPTDLYAKTKVPNITLIRPWIDGGGYTGAVIMLENTWGAYILQPTIQNFSDGNWSYTDFSGDGTHGSCAANSNTLASAGIIIKGTTGDDTNGVCGWSASHNRIVSGQLTSNTGGANRGTGLRLITTGGSTTNIPNHNHVENTLVQQNTVGIANDLGNDNFYTQIDGTNSGWAVTICTTNSARYCIGNRITDIYGENTTSGVVWLTNKAQSTLVDTLASTYASPIQVQDDDNSWANGNQVWLHRYGLGTTIQAAPVSSVPQEVFRVQANGHLNNLTFDGDVVPPTDFYTTMAWGPLTSIPGAGSYSGFQTFAAPNQGVAGTKVLSLTASSSAYTCSVAPSLKIYDCGASVTCASPTAINGTALTVNQANKAFWTTTFSHASVGHGNYVAAEWTGTCTAFNPQVTIAASNE